MNMSTSSITTQPDFAAILRTREEFAVANDSSMGNRLNRWFDDLMIQSGSGTSPTMTLAISFCSALTFSGAVFVIQENLLTTGLAALLGLILPVLVIVILRHRRRNRIARQLPEMIDELARAGKAGRSLEKALILVAHDTPAPLGKELLECTRKLELGMTVPEALAELPRRTGLDSLRILATALAVHVQTGGDLVKVLERLSLTLRSRAQFLGRLKAATAASRATAILMLGLPPAILAFFLFRDPEYLSKLFASEWGARITLAAFVLQFVGAVWVLQVLKSSQRV